MHNIVTDTKRIHFKTLAIKKNSIIHVGYYPSESLVRLTLNTFHGLHLSVLLENLILSGNTKLFIA